MLLSQELSAEMIGKKFSEVWRLQGGLKGLEPGTGDRLGLVGEAGPMGEVGIPGLEADLKGDPMGDVETEELEVGPVGEAGPAGLEVGPVSKVGAGGL